MRLTIFLILLLMLPASGKAAIMVVSNNADSGPGSLRQAIDDANSAPGSDSIVFNLPGPSLQIDLLSPLPDITGALVVDGLTQPGASMPGNPVVLFGIGFVKHAVQCQTDNIAIRNLKFAHFVYSFSSNQSGAIISYNFGGGNVRLDSIEISNNIFEGNNSGINFYYPDTLTHIFIGNNVFYGNYTSVALNGSYGTAVLTDIRIANNLSSDTVGIAVTGRRLINIEVDSNFLSNPDKGITITANRAINISVFENELNDYSSGNIGISFDPIRCNNVTIHHNRFYGIWEPIMVRSLISSVPLELENISITNNEIFDLPHIGIFFWLASSGSQGFLNNVEVAHNTVHSGDSSGYGIFFWDMSDLDYTDINIHHNVMHPAGLQGGIKLWLDDLVTVTGLVISDNLIEAAWNGIYLETTGSPGTVFNDFRIARNVIEQCAYSGIRFWGHSNGMVPPYFTHGVIDSNTIAGSSQDAILFSGFCTNGQLYFDSIYVHHNLLFQNGRSGIYMNLDDCLASRIFFSENSIYDNGQLGIDIDQTVLQYGLPYVPIPNIDSAQITASIITIYGSVYVIWPNRDYILEFFLNQQPDASGFGEGEVFLFSDTINSGPSGFMPFSFSGPFIPTGSYVSATLTDLVMECTSEFSNVSGAVFTSLPEFDNSVFSLHPNPVTDKIYLHDFAGPLEIYDNTGKLVMNVPSKEGSSVMVVDVSQFYDGLYMIRSGNRQVKFIKVGY